MKKTALFFLILLLSTSLRTAPPEKRNRPASKASSRSGFNVSSDQEKGAQVDQRDISLRSRKFGIRILPSTLGVKNPDFALDRPDGRPAAISMLGILDIEINAVNGPGMDIAIYARLKGAEEMKTEQAEGGVPVQVMSHSWIQGPRYIVLAMNKNGEWIGLGRGQGNNNREEFELGEISAADKIRIMFRPSNNAILYIPSGGATAIEITVLIDAVAALH